MTTSMALSRLLARWSQSPAASIVGMFDEAGGGVPSRSLVMDLTGISEVEASELIAANRTSCLRPVEYLSYLKLKYEILERPEGLFVSEGEAA